MEGTNVYDVRIAKINAVAQIVSVAIEKGYIGSNSADLTEYIKEVSLAVDAIPK